MSVPSSQLLTLSLNPDTHLYWQNWKKGIPRLKYIPSGGSSLQIPVQVRTEAGTIKQLTALVDTGAAIHLVMRAGIFPAAELQKTVWPVKFMTASVAVMSGGTTGMKL